MLTDFQNYFADRLTGKFCNKLIFTYMPPHLKYIATVDHGVK